MSIEQEFNCMGYFGFGTGVALSRAMSQGQQPTAGYCNGCVLASPCWAMHRARVYRFVPDLAAHIDKLGKEKDGKRKIIEFIKDNGTEPFMGMMMGNLD